MLKRILWLLLSSLMALSLVLASCGEAEEEEEEVIIPPEEEEEVVVPGEEEEEVKPPVGGNWWDYHGEPQYGSTLVWRLKTDITGFDQYRSTDRTGITALYSEALAMMGWTADRETCPYKGGFTPLDCRDPLVAESWELDNYEQYTFHIRPGVYWQDKPPLNGRELTAYDIEYGWHRHTGLGSGYTEPSPYTYFKGWADFESITAKDKYTIVFKMKYSCPGMWKILPNYTYPQATPRELIEEYGNLEDWRNAVGTGPFILTDYVPGSSASYVSNPNYWGYDQRHPENKLPYLEGVKLLIIPDDSTAYAALRTGKICMVTGVKWEQAASFEKTNPEIKQAHFPLQGYAVTMRIDKSPFTDINVRKALTMAIDVKTIAETYYGGRVDGKPTTIFSEESGPWYTPFEEWPKDVQEGHTYNPEGAKKLLAEAGYPNGFKTNMLVSSADDLDLPQIVQGYFKEIGVDMEIKVVEATTYFSYVNLYKKHDQMVWGRQGVTAVGGWLPQYSAKEFMFNNCMISDPVLDELIDRAALYPPYSEENIGYNVKADLYAFPLYLAITTGPDINYVLYQPWLKGYSDESITTPDSAIFARWWIDQDLKKAMGH